MFVVAGVVWVIVVALDASELGEPLPALELLTGLFVSALLVLRRRAPVSVAVAAILGSAFAPTAGGAAFLAVFSLAVHRSPRWTLPFGVAFVLASVVSSIPRAGWSADSAGQIIFSVVLSALAIVGGSMVRHRRRLILSLFELARSAEAVERARTDQVRATERALLAGEMHDVLAHRMSLVAIHAGALEYAVDLPPDDVCRAAGVIRAGVHQTLVDLRDIIGVLRDDSTDLDTLGPPPTLAEVHVLFEESESAGTPVDALIHIDEVRDAVPRQVDRTAYRVVQEGLTNARKHAGTAPVSVVIRGSVREGLAVQISQPLIPGESALPGSESGLLGLSERAVLVGGSIEYGRRGDDFVLSAHFPLEIGAPHGP
ncbi:hypothetical protein ASE14_00965 [Agromyces sp. Root81]|nr:hypothetical protein ASE14_00965 [Agromyces sp. Root81]